MSKNWLNWSPGTRIDEHDWNLTLGRNVGIATEEEVEDFDFAETLRSTHVELEGLNEEGVELAALIAT